MVWFGCGFFGVEIVFAGGLGFFLGCWVVHVFGVGDCFYYELILRWKFSVEV